MNATVLSRRALLAASGALLIGFSTEHPWVGTAQAAGLADLPPPPPDELDSFIAVQKDGSVIAFFGKVDPGQGVNVPIGQIVADELDVPYDHVQVVMGDTFRTVNQGGASGSTGIERGGISLRYAAAEARRVLIDRASSRLGVPAGDLGTADGAVFVLADPSRRVLYGDLTAGGPFDTKLRWNGKIGNELVSRGQAQPKSPSEYKIVGQSIPRSDIRANVFAQQHYVTDIRLPDMLHARVLRPPVAGAEPLSVDDSGLATIPTASLVRLEGPGGGTIVAVTAEREWNAIRAMDAVKISWSRPAPTFLAQAQLYDHIRAAPVVTRQEPVRRGDVASALESATRVISAEYEWPFQSHASMAGGCAVADVRPDSATVYSGTQKPHFQRDGLSRLLDLPPEDVRVIWTRGPGCYGRNDAGDAAMEAALLSRATGRPVRLQYMRDQGIAWDPKGPASIHRCRGGLDAMGEVIAYSFESKGFSRLNVNSAESDPRDTLPGQLLGMGQRPTQAFGYPGEAYGFPAMLLAWETIPPLLPNASPLRTTHLRDPVGPQINFASESFIDELAAAAGKDPIEFRLTNLRNPRGVSVIKAAAEKYGWQARPAAAARGKGDLLTGRGVAYAERAHTFVAVVVEIDIDRRTGMVHPKRWIVAHDCGLIVNPAGLQRTIEGNVLHASSRALLEEVAFDPDKVTSVDWVTYPILEIGQAPERIDVVAINRPDQPPAGAGEASSRPVAAAIANAIFDATGVRLRRAPFTPARVRGALA